MASHYFKLRAPSNLPSTPSLPPLPPNYQVFTSATQQRPFPLLLQHCHFRTQTQTKELHSRANREPGLEYHQALIWISVVPLTSASLLLQKRARKAASHQRWSIRAKAHCPAANQVRHRQIIGRMRLGKTTGEELQSKDCKLALSRIRKAKGLSAACGGARLGLPGGEPAAGGLGLHATGSEPCHLGRLHHGQWARQPGQGWLLGKQFKSQFSHL